jgi:hypothetical protein
MHSREMKAAVDPRKAAEHVKKMFAGFAELPKSEQRVLLEKYVSKIIYHESNCFPVAIPGQCDHSIGGGRTRVLHRLNGPHLRLAGVL